MFWWIRSAAALKSSAPNGPSGCVGAPASVVSQHRPLCDVSEPSPAGVFLTHVRPTVSRHRCDVAVMGWAAGLRLPSLQPSSSGVGEGSGFQGPGADVGGSFLASAPLVPVPSGAASGDPPLPATKEGSSQTATLPPEPVRTSADCLSYIRRSACQASFSDAVASQLTHCRRRSTRVNYQAKWLVYHSWCHRHGHSVSRPTVAKVADFLLYLRRSLSLSYSSIASYRSMLSGVFRFILPELSSRFVLHDLLCAFRLERPLSSSRVPPWDLLVVLQFLRGPPFEPLASASLRALIQKVLFLVSLATARRVGELQAVSREVSFSGSDAYLSYLLEFRAKTESAVNPLPRSFCVRSLKDFVGDLPDELLLCPVRALRSYLARTSSLSPRPRTLFVSPRSFSKNALRFFLRDVISRAPPLLLLPLLLHLLRRGLIVCVGLRLRGRLRVMLRCRPFWLWRLGPLLRSSPPSISRMYSSLLLLVLTWVLWWRLVPWCRCF